jgi:hypothetical protein
MGKEEMFSPNDSSNAFGNQDRLESRTREQHFPNSWQPRREENAAYPNDNGTVRKITRESEVQAESNGIEAQSTRVHQDRALPDLTGIFKPISINNREGALQEQREASNPGMGIMKTTDMLSNVKPPASQDELGFTQMFHTLGQEAANRDQISQSPGLSNQPEMSQEPSGDLGSSGPQQDPPQAKHQSTGGEFTRLFQKLDERSREEIHSPLPAEMKSSLTESPLQSDGGFTQLLRTLSWSDSAEQQSASSAPELQIPQRAGGPGEFTQIISASLLRDANNRSDVNTRSSEGSQPDGLAPGTSAPHMQGGGLAMPPTTLPKNVENIPGNETGSSPELPVHERRPSIAAPVPIRNSGPATATNGASSETHLQRYIPLLLITNVFLIVLVLVLVGILLVHH